MIIICSIIFCWMTRAEERSSVFSPDGMIESEYERFRQRLTLTRDDNTLVRSLFPFICKNSAHLLAIKNFIIYHKKYANHAYNQNIFIFIYLWIFYPG